MMDKDLDDRLEVVAVIISEVMFISLAIIFSPILLMTFIYSYIKDRGD